MSLHLAEIAQTVAPGAHAALLLGQAGRHTTGKLAAPADLTPLPLPARAPELHPVEHLWQGLTRELARHPRLQVLRRHPRPTAATLGAF